MVGLEMSPSTSALLDIKESPMARKTKVITVTLKVEVDLDTYAAEYGLPREDAAADAADHLPYVVIDAAGYALDRLGYATVKAAKVR